MTSNGSLGFNPNRRHRASTLPGTISAAAPRVPPPRRRVQQQQTVKNDFPAPKRLPEKEAAPSTSPPVPPPQPCTPPSPPAEHLHWVYATVGDEPLRAADAPSDIVCVKHSRVLLTYPMVANADTGVVSMKAKSVDGETGQLSWRWVHVYDPNTDTRLVSDFSLLP